MKKIMVGVLALGASTLPLWAQTPAKTAWDGVFTADQAAAGKTVFDAKCAMCHGAELGGAEMAPALTGGMFLGNWGGQAVGDLSTRIHATMPANDPGSLSNKDTANVTAYILSFNQFPAGSTALPDDPQLQGQIKIVAEKPAGK